MPMNEQMELEKRLDSMRDQHQLLDQMIDDLSAGNFQDQLQLHRLKKERLALRDKICQLEDAVYPDIIA